MRLLIDKGHGDLNLVEHYDNSILSYATLSHTRGADNEEVTFNFQDLMKAMPRTRLVIIRYILLSAERKLPVMIYNISGWRPVALYSPTTGDNAPRKGRYLPPKKTGVVTQL
jgi:hypothetical protein